MEGIIENFTQALVYLNRGIVQLRGISPDAANAASRFVNEISETFMTAVVDADVLLDTTSTSTAPLAGRPSSSVGWGGESTGGLRRESEDSGVSLGTTVSTSVATSTLPSSTIGASSSSMTVPLGYGYAVTPLEYGQYNPLRRAVPAVPPGFETLTAAQARLRSLYGDDRDGPTPRPGQLGSASGTSLTGSGFTPASAPSITTSHAAVEQRSTSRSHMSDIKGKGKQSLPSPTAASDTSTTVSAVSDTSRDVLIKICIPRERICDIPAVEWSPPAYAGATSSSRTTGNDGNNTRADDRNKENRPFGGFPSSQSQSTSAYDMGMTRDRRSSSILTSGTGTTNTSTGTVGTNTSAIALPLVPAAASSARSFSAAVSSLPAPSTTFSPRDQPITSTSDRRVLWIFNAPAGATLRTVSQAIKEGPLYSIVFARNLRHQASNNGGQGQTSSTGESSISMGGTVGSARGGETSTNMMTPTTTTTTTAKACCVIFHEVAHCLTFMANYLARLENQSLPAAQHAPQTPSQPTFWPHEIVLLGAPLPFTVCQGLTLMDYPTRARRRLTIARRALFAPSSHNSSQTSSFAAQQLSSSGGMTTNRGSGSGGAALPPPPSITPTDFTNVVHALAGGRQNVELVFFYNSGNATVILSSIRCAWMVKCGVEKLARGGGKALESGSWSAAPLTFAEQLRMDKEKDQEKEGMWFRGGSGSSSSGVNPGRSSFAMGGPGTSIGIGNANVWTNVTVSFSKDPCEGEIRLISAMGGPPSSAAGGPSSAGGAGGGGATSSSAAGQTSASTVHRARKRV
ncbi:MAG: hypothetical protein M1817_003344 [Caeruleum heppii]|nr:MAG: hypothetical protein M1817_003344 [Caeruleum heppii]